MSFDRSFKTKEPEDKRPNYPHIFNQNTAKRKLLPASSAMTTKWTCPHCGKDDFKRSAGLTQHLKSSARCKERDLEAHSKGRSTRSQAALLLAREVGASNQVGVQRWTRSAATAMAEVNDADVSADSTRKRGQESAAEVDKNGEDDEMSANTLTMENEGSDIPNECSDIPTDEGDIMSVDDASAKEEDAGDSDEEAKHKGPNTHMRDRFREFCKPGRFRLPLTQAELGGVRLLDILRRKKAPMNAYKDVFEWHLKEKGILKHNQGVGEAWEHYIGRETLLDNLAKRYNMVGRAPFVRTVRLPHSKEVVKIPCHKAEDCMERLLTNPKLTKEDFIWFNDDPLAPPPEEELDYIGDCKTGDAYRQTHKVLIKGPNEQLIGAIFYIDGTVTGQFSDLPVTSLKISLDCFTREARTKPHMWVELGWVPIIKKAEGRGKKLLKESQHLDAEDINIFDGEGEEVEGEEDDYDPDEGTSPTKAQDFHHMLAIILESYVDLQETGFVWDLPHGKKVLKDMHNKLFTPMVKCDTEEGDTLCAKYKPRTKNVKHLCRYCHCPTSKAGHYSAKYPYKTQKDIEKLIKGGKLEKLKAMSQHDIENSWYKVRFNLGNDRGIHCACPSDKTHAVDLGTLKRVREIFFTDVGENAAVAEDIAGLARVYGKFLAHQSDRSMPLTNFSNSIGEGRKMAKEYKGVILLIAAILRSTLGRKLVGTKKKFRQDHTKDDWLLLVELLLEWEAYLCEPRMLRRHVVRLEKKTRFIMYILKKVANRTKGMGWGIMKFHAMTHMVHDILLYGVPLEFDTGANESHHKASKMAARLTQRSAATFNPQVAQRLFEFHLLDLALEEIQNDNPIWDYYARELDRPLDDLEVEGDIMVATRQHADQSSEKSDQNDEHSDQMDEAADEPLVKTSTGDAKIKVYWDEEAQENSFLLLSKGKKAKDTLINIELIDFLCSLQDKVLDCIPDSFLQIYTMHTRNDQIFHGHPNYRGQGPWKDWVIVDWGRRHGKTPCHIHCFVDLENGDFDRKRLEHGGVALRKGVYAVVEASQYENNEAEIKRSDLFVPLLKDVDGMDGNDVKGRLFFLADTQAFEKPCCVIPDIGGPPNRYFLVKPRTEWAGLFTKWLDDPHNIDNISDEEEDEE